MSDDITVPRQEYKGQIESLELNRLAIGGARPVHAAGQKCLTPLASMKTTATEVSPGKYTTSYSSSLSEKGALQYAKYLSNATFIGFTGQTVTGLKGLIKSKPAVPVIPSTLAYLEDNIDGCGTSLEALGDKCISEAFPSIRQLLLITAPETDGNNSKLDDESNNIRPKLAHYTQESITNWHYEVVNNKQELVMLVLKESTTKRDGFKVEVEPQYRHLALLDGVYQQELRDKDNKIITPMTPVKFNGQTINRIPVRIAETGVNGKAMIDDLVDANMEHYNLYADYGNKLHESSFVVWWESGVQEGEGANVTMGPGTKWFGGDNAKFGVLQPDGNSDGHRIALKDTEHRMSNLGADMLKETGAAESGTAKALDKVSTNSTTMDLANCISEMITLSLEDIAEYWKVTGEISYTLNTDYDPNSLDYQMVQTIGGLFETDLIDREEAQNNLKEAGIIRADRDLDEMNKNISNEADGLDKDAE